MNEAAEAVLQFWFGDQTDDLPAPDAIRSRWWTKDPEFDAEVRQRFGDQIEAAERGELAAWIDEPRSALALVLLCDQMTRNSRRDTAAMYSADDVGLAAARAAVERGHDRELRTIEAQFLYMPFMHAESVEAQREAVALFTGLAERAPEPCRAGAEGTVDYAHKHAVIVERFGRFPHRNRILARESTPEELEFLEQPGSSF